MPVRPRQITDTPTEARIRQVIRSILDQEVRRLLNANAALQSLVNTNTSNISANASAIAAAADDIDNAERRAAARNNEGVISSKALDGASGGGVTSTDTSFTGEQTWTVSIDGMPVQVTLWERQSFSSAANFDTFQFDTVLFDQAEEVLAETDSPSVTYNTTSQVLSIDWGSNKTGTLYLLNIGNGTAYAVIAVAD